MLKNDHRQSATRTLKVEHLSLINHNALVNPDCDMDTLMCWLCSLVEHACIDHDPLHYLHHHLHHQLPSLLLHQRRQGQLSFPIATDMYHDYKLQIKLTAPKKSKKAQSVQQEQFGQNWWEDEQPLVWMFKLKMTKKSSTSIRLSAREWWMKANVLWQVCDKGWQCLFVNQFTHLFMWCFN